MKQTNRLNLPEALVNFDNGEYTYNENRYSVTELLKPIREIKLTRKYYNDIEIDVADKIPAIFGTAVHYIFEKNTPNDSNLKPEFKLECEIDGVTIAGIIDLLDLRNLVINDYKTSSVSKITKQDFDDWKKQGLAYAYLVFKKHGLIIRKLKFYAILKDWSKLKAVNGGNYPSAPVYVWEYDIKDSDYDYIENYLRGKIALLKSNELPMCTDTEKWYTGDKYAVYKNASDKRASIVCDTEQEAHDYITNKCNGAGIIDVRKGESLKCKYYCNVCKYCKSKEELNG